MALRYVVRQNVLICIVSRHFSHFFLSINFFSLNGSLHCWSVAGLLRGASPKTPVIPRAPALLINRYWTGLATSCPGGSCSEGISRIPDGCWRAKPADRKRGRYIFFLPEVHKNNFMRKLLFFRRKLLFFFQENIRVYIYLHTHKQ